MRYLVGVDDTDNLESRGTGFRARQLGEKLTGLGAVVNGITRHQLLVSPEIPYTSHNSSACLDLDADEHLCNPIWSASREFLLSESAPGSDAGLCMAQWGQLAAEICDFGEKAKQSVLTQMDAYSLAEKVGIKLEGLTGTGGGVIGALAAVGLHAGGDDGRYLWIKGIRELTGVYSVSDICRLSGLQAVITNEGCVLSGNEIVELSEWNRPVLRGGQAVLLVEEAKYGSSQWRVLSKDEVKRISQ